MTLLFTCKNLSSSYGSQLLFKDLDMMIKEKEHIGLIGSNGSGKSTLLKIIAGFKSPDSGDLSFARGLKISSLLQNPEFNEDKSLLSILEERVLNKLEDGEDYGKVWRIIGEAGFSDLKVNYGSLSGGWRKKFAIVCALTDLPDLLLLDEPTNHLDIEGILWLEEELQKTDAAFILVSHDRRFLERVSHRIIELGSIYPKAYFEFSGSFDEFKRARDAFLSQERSREARLENRMRREADWLSRMPKARTTKAQYRIDAAARLEEELSELRFRNRQDKKIRLEFDHSQSKSKRLLEAFSLSARVDDRLLFSDISFVLAPGSRLGVLGKNGSGKSSFMRILAGELAPHKGEIRTIDGLSILYFDQAREALDESLTLKEALCPEGDSVIYKGKSVHITAWASRFLFKPEQLNQPLGKLSGGEKARVLLANLIRTPADILLLDEPTNDLDIPSLEVLEESLGEFSGALVLVSHDRYFMDSLCQRVLALDGEGGADFFADVEQWLDSLKKKEKKIVEKKVELKTPPREKKAKSFTYKMQLELDGMEERILKAESDLEGLNLKLNDPELQSDPLLLADSCKQLDSLNQEIEFLYKRWGELEELKKE